MPSRRRVLQTCAAFGAVGVAGCINDGTAGDAGSESRTDPPSDATGTPTAAPTAGDVGWRRSLSGPVDHRPTLAGDRLFVGSGDGAVTALSRHDGSVAWSFANDDGEPVRGAPVVTGDAVVAVTGGAGLGEHHVVHALGRDSGEERWRFAPESWWLDVVGTAGGTAFVATTDDAVADGGQTLYALSLADGSTQWSVEVGDNRGGLVTDERVYVPSMATVRAVERDGDVGWTAERGEYQYGTLAVAGETVSYVTASDPREPRVLGLDPATGDRRWLFDEWRAHTTRAVDDRLFVGGERVARIDPATGETEWVADQRAALYDAPVADGTLYTAGETAAAIATDDGSTRWEAGLEAYLASPAGLAADRLVLRKSASREDSNRHVVALERTSGDRAWVFAAESELTRLAVGSERVYAGEGSDVLALAA